MGYTSHSVRALSSAGLLLAAALGGTATGAQAAVDGATDEGQTIILESSQMSEETAWSAYGLSGSLEGGEVCGTYLGPNVNEWDAGFGFDHLVLPAGDYVASFDSKSELPFIAKVQQSGGDYTRLGTLNVEPSADFEHHEMTFSSDVPFSAGEFAFHLGTKEKGSYEVCVTNVFLAVQPTNYVQGGDFSEGLGAWQAEGVTPTVTGEGVCLAVPSGTADAADARLVVADLALPAFAYTLHVDASGDEVPVRMLVTSHNDPSTVYGDTTESVSGDASTLTSVFAIEEADARVDVALEFGGGQGGEVCVSSVALLSGGEAPAFVPEAGPRMRVNQVGYEPAAPKRATLVTEATEPVSWALLDEAGSEVAQGESVPFGMDESSGLHVHVIDFSDYTTEGTYTLAGDDAESYPFAIEQGLYEQLRYDALNYFYLARSGIDIDAAIVGDEYARAAGHLGSPGGSETNQGDYGVACQPADDSAAIYGEPWTCDYTLDVVGGWYDAGDHGKYVVNGGIAAYQLMSAYERSLRADEAGLGDAVLNVPEVGNDIPDILDEAKWELDFMASMQVPEGEQHAGMVHHKVHDFGWTSLPLMPADDSYTRYLHRPSTAATLNLAATAAQGARLFDRYDSDYADHLLAVATTAWQAAVANPEIYAPVTDGSAGGGPYDDDDVTDEFYWAAAELYLTTGDGEYADFVAASPLHTADVFGVGGFDWGSTAALGRLDLATVDSDIEDRAAIQASVVEGADAVLGVQARQGFEQALGAEDFVWGSNSLVLNNMVVLGTAYDLTGQTRYLDAVRTSMDYLLGRNALGQSYVTGYGTVFSENQHSRWYAHQLDESYPHPPAGSVAGGPNADVASWDSTIAGLYPKGECAPQTCYVDDINSWSTNEITINWNSALGWVATFLAAPEAPVVEGGGSSGAPWWVIAVALVVVLAIAWAVWRRLRAPGAADTAQGPDGSGGEPDTEASAVRPDSTEP